MQITRRATRQITLGNLAIGGGAAISVQTMTKTATTDVDATLEQISEVESLGCDIIRIAVPDEAAAKALSSICGQVKMPLVADIHFDHKLAIMALEAGADGLRINPGNIGDRGKVEEVVAAARDKGAPIRIGVNSGSVEADLLEKHGSATSAALVESAMRHVRMIEDAGYDQLKISVKASDVTRTVTAYRLLSEQTDYPLHLGVTEAGTLVAGTIRSSVAMGILLSEGIGDTIRVSLTDTPAREVRVGLELLRSLGLREPGPNVISCPTCGRIGVDVISIATRVEDELEAYYLANPDAARPLVAIMGCMVNGPGEAAEADIALAGGEGKFALYLTGQHHSTVTESEAVDALMALIREFHPADRHS